MGHYRLIEEDVRDDTPGFAAQNNSGASRRSFLKASLATSALSVIPLHAEASEPRKPLPAFPRSRISQAWPMVHMNDWCCIAGGAFTDRVIDTIFGADLTLSNGVQVQSRVADFDANARLRNLRHQGKNYLVSAKGATAVS
jgi:hypothetical protein